MQLKLLSFAGDFVLRNKSAKLKLKDFWINLAINKFQGKKSVGYFGFIWLQVPGEEI